MKRAVVLSTVSIAAVVFLAGARAGASVDQAYFLSENNKLYFVLKIDNTSGIGAQITSLIMTSGSALPLNETAGDRVVTSVSSQLSGGILQFPPLSNIKRTAVIGGFASNDIVPGDSNPLNGEWNPVANGGDGLLTLPGGTETVTFDGSGTIPVQAITTASAGIPAAVETVVNRGPVFGAATIVFPNPSGTVVTSDEAGGEVSNQNVSLDETLGSRIGNDASGAAQENAIDGFLVRNTQDIIVFMVDGNGFSSFGLSASGFSVSSTTLAERNVLDSTGDVDNGLFNATAPPPPPRPTPGTPTPVASAAGLLALALALAAFGSTRLRQAI